MFLRVLFTYYEFLCRIDYLRIPSQKFLSGEYVQIEFMEFIEAMVNIWISGPEKKFINSCHLCSESYSQLEILEVFFSGFWVNVILISVCTVCTYSKQEHIYLQLSN